LKHLSQEAYDRHGRRRVLMLAVVAAFGASLVAASPVGDGAGIWQ
jgi:hypothetical protein